MLKLHPEEHNGTEFIRIASLPLNQMIHFKNWLSETSIFTIYGLGDSIHCCAHYEDYEFWYDNYKGENPDSELSLF